VFDKNDEVDNEHGAHQVDYANRIAKLEAEIFDLKKRLVQKGISVGDIEKVAGTSDKASTTATIAEVIQQKIAQQNAHYRENKEATEEKKTSETPIFT
jgi:SOS response regulatory protein OraA/RecX